MTDTSTIGDRESALTILLGELRELIRRAHQNALRAVDTIQVQTCWELGRHVVEVQQAGATRAEQNQRLPPTLPTALTAEFGKGVDERNLRHMRSFYQSYPKLVRGAVRIELDPLSHPDAGRSSSR